MNDNVIPESYETGPNRVSLTVKVFNDVRDEINELVKSRKYSSLSDFVIKAISEKMEREKIESGPMNEIEALLKSEEGQALLNKLLDKILLERATKGLQSQNQ